METDISLRALAEACGPDLLELLGSPGATVIGVESPELPATARRLDTLFRLRSARGTPYLHLVEWQGYRDPEFLQRILGYLATLIRREPGIPIEITLFYLNPRADVGDTIEMVLDGVVLFRITIRCIRLWQLPARAAVASGRVGLAVLSPLMADADAETVSQAADLVRAEVTPEQGQGDLLTILGALSEGLTDAATLRRIVGEGFVIRSKFIGSIVEDEINRRMEEERDTAHDAVRMMSLRMVEDAITVRFPAIAFPLVRPILGLRDSERLVALHHALLLAPDQAAAEQALRQASAEPTGQ